MREENIEYWKEISEYDLETAKAMMKTKRFLYVGFMCHQAVEKILKGYFVYQINEEPPYTHNLFKLAKNSNLYEKLSENDKDFIDYLDPLNIQARYPSYRENLIAELTEDRCLEILEKTETLQKWIKKML